MLQCCHGRFSQIQAKCTSEEPNTAPYGVDSVFKLGSVNFNPDLYDPEGEPTFNSGPTFQGPHGHSTLVGNIMPWL